MASCLRLLLGLAYIYISSHLMLMIAGADLLICRCYFSLAT